MKLKLSLLICSIVLSYTITFAQHGGLDNTFGTNGVARMSLGPSLDFCADVAVQSDGKILLVGTYRNGSTDDLFVVRYNTDGTLDFSFATDGVASVDFAGEESGHSIVVLPDDKVLVGGYRHSPPNRDMLIFKFNSDGSDDMTFGTNGRVDIDFGSTDDMGNELLDGVDGKITITGRVQNGDERDFAAARFLADGTIDNSFGTLGQVTFDIVETDFCTSSVLQPDGKLILFGTISLAGNSDFAILRCNVDGTLDDSFGSDGIEITDFAGPDEDDLGTDVALQSDGKIVAVGTTNSTNLGVARYNTNGTLDDSFGTGGLVSEPFVDVEVDEFTEVAIQSDGKIVIAGTFFSTNYAQILVRLNSNGSFDNTFGTNGVVITDLAPEDTPSNGIAIQADSKILVCGGWSDFAVARYLSGLNFGVVDFSIEMNSLFVYPNPIQESTAIEYTLTNNETISIVLYDISGRLVQPVINSEKRYTGPQKEIYNLDTSIPSGSYILRLSNGVGSTSIQLVK